MNPLVQTLALSPPAQIKAEQDIPGEQTMYQQSLLGAVNPAPVTDKSFNAPAPVTQPQQKNAFGTFVENMFFSQDYLNNRAGIGSNMQRRIELEQMREDLRSTKNTNDKAEKKASRRARAIEYNQTLDPNMPLQQRINKLAVMFPEYAAEMKGAYVAHGDRVQQYEYYKREMGQQGLPSDNFDTWDMKRRKASSGIEQPVLLTHDEKIRYGLDTDKPYFWNTKSGKPEIADKMTEKGGMSMQAVEGMLQSEKEMAAFLEENPNYQLGNTYDTITGELSTGTGLASIIARKFLTPEMQHLLPLMQNFVNYNRVILSGAAVPEQEVVRDFFTYYPLPGERPETVAMKNRLRAGRIASIKAMAIMSPGQRSEAVKELAAIDRINASTIENLASQKGKEPPAQNRGMLGLPEGFDPTKFKLVK